MDKNETSVFVVISENPDEATVASVYSNEESAKKLVKKFREDFLNMMVETKEMWRVQTNTDDEFTIYNSHKDFYSIHYSCEEVKENEE